LEGFTARTAWLSATGLWWLLLLVWVVMRFGIKPTKRREGWGQYARHVLAVAVGFWLLFGSGTNGGWFDQRWLPDVPTAWGAGLLLTAAGVAASIWARGTLGKNWSSAVTLKADHQLIRHGLYRRIRHPIYSGILLGMIGTAMILGRLRGLVGCVVVFGAFYVKARREEQFLRQEFGKEFEEHTRRTGMFLPKWTEGARTGAGTASRG